MSRFPLIIREYRPEWADHFSTEAAVIAAALGEHLVAIHHIGSTAVEGLSAKPVIDILAEVMNPDAPTAESGLIQAGYQPRGENGIPGRRYFTKGVQARTHQIHAFLPGSPHIIRHLAFRNYLRHFPAIRHEYAAVKYAAQRACQGDMKIYRALKHDFIQFHQQRALALFPF
ncbi:MULTISPECIES: GrpB family protein [Pantoea]|jgi:GrpB-like predicted nucleotidyltransferase (UPF0157 family)|uniref:GrpB family protein n=1 Tax=Pantoea TaxID=53335 RepID=UPI00076323B4|nr:MULTISPECIES: GrpB family protein [Pantoea]AMB77250.1 hypothetical protein AW734_21110 [Pantoea ananatis]MDI3363269.1 GrpB family protein [Pantoea sp. V108_6]OWY75425.1 GrpB family protein [Pantoea sp. AMG 501]